MVSRGSRLFPALALLVLAAVPGVALGDDDSGERKIPDEYESTGGHSLGLNNGGVAALGGVSSVRTNPAMLTMEKQYAVDAGYHWPTRGREFYQLGVVDSKTSSVAAGLLYTGSGESYERDGEDARYDSPVKRRATVALAQSFDKMAVGVSGQYVEATSVGTSEDEKAKGMTIGLGAAGLLTPAMRIGASVENLANRKVQEYAPRYIRAGGAYVMAEGVITTHLDYVQRERVGHFEGDLPQVDLVGTGSSGSDDDGLEGSEQMILASFSAKFRDFLCLVGGYGHALTDERRSVTGGVAVVSDKFSLSYSAARPYLQNPASHQAVNFSIKVNL
jgi:hypothetical protein